MTPNKEKNLYRNVVRFCFESSFLKVLDISSCLVNISSFLDIIKFSFSFCLPNVLMILSFRITSFCVKSKLLLTNFISTLQMSPLTRSVPISLATAVSITTLFCGISTGRVFVCVTFCEILLPHTSIIRLKLINLSFFIFF